MKKILILTCLILNISCFSQSSENNSHKILKTDLIDENLKGPVKSYNLTVKYLDLRNKNNNGNRIATPKGDDENVFVEYNKYGLMTSSLLGIYNDSLVLEPMESRNLIDYKYNEYDLIYKSKFSIPHNYPPMLTQQFYHIFPNRSDYYNYDQKYAPVVNEVYAMNYDEDKNTLTDVVFFRESHHKNDLKANDNEVTNYKNIKNKWHYEYNSLGQLKKIKIERKINLGFIIKYFKHQIKSYSPEITFEYDKQNRLIKYSVFDIDKKEEIGYVAYSYDPKYEFVESETIYQKYSGEYYLSNVHYYTLKYNKQGDLIANLLQVELKDEQLVRKEQLYLDKFYEYNYDENDNWTECKIRVNNPTSEISAIMNRKIEYFKE